MTSFGCIIVMICAGTRFGTGKNPRPYSLKSRRSSPGRAGQGPPPERPRHLVIFRLVCEFLSQSALRAQISSLLHRVSGSLYACSATLRSDFHATIPTIPPWSDVVVRGRIALSSFGHFAKSEHAIVVQTTLAPPILSVFPREAATLAAGNPVYERWTTTFYDGLSQTDNETFVLNNQTVTITENITLPGTDGTETVVDHFTAIQGGVLYQNTVTEPNGQTEAETRTDTFEGPGKILYHGSFERPDGVTVTFTGNSVNHGREPSSTNRTMSRTASPTRLMKWISIRASGNRARP